MLTNEMIYPISLDGLDKLTENDDYNVHAINHKIRHFIRADRVLLLIRDRKTHPMQIPDNIMRGYLTETVDNRIAFAFYVDLSRVEHLFVFECDDLYSTLALQKDVQEYLNFYTTPVKPATPVYLDMIERTKRV